jgi:hypothetical protein
MPEEVEDGDGGEPRIHGCSRRRLDIVEDIEDPGLEVEKTRFMELEGGGGRDRLRKTGDAEQ